jgi:hypothetical protein
MEDIIQAALDDEPSTADELARSQVAMRLNSMISELDEFVAMAANGETVDLIEAEALAFGQVYSRVNLIVAFLQAHKPKPQFRLVK